MSAPLLIEIGCEEIPARMIRPAARDLAARVERILDQAGLARGALCAWGGPRRLAVRLDDVQDRQPDRDELVLGPPVSAAFDDEGRATPAAVGFARKQNVETPELERVETERGVYVGLKRRVTGQALERVLAEGLPAAVEGMSFPKTMRWGEGCWRWVRPVQWLLALHGARALDLELFGVRSGETSSGHRFLGSREVAVAHADGYVETLRRAAVLVDPAERRRVLGEALERAGAALGGAPVADDGLLEEVADLVEWPGVVAGRFDAAYLDLPRDLLVTTLRHHQKCFSVQQGDGKLLPAFLAVANTDRDVAGHVRRGNEWVVGGRLDDARYFWSQDRQSTLDSRGAKLAGVTFHARLGSYMDKAERLARLSGEIAAGLGLEPRQREHCRRAAELCKHDLVTGTVGEFPELQGRIGGLLLAAEGAPDAVGRAVYEHYLPQAADDPVPSTVEGAVIALADKLDTVSELVRVGESPTGSRDPFGLRRATNGLLRIVLERGWPLSLDALCRLGGGAPTLRTLLVDRLQNFLRERGYTPNELNAVLRPRVSPEASLGWPIRDVVARLDALGTVRERDDFAHLVELTKRVDNILTRNAETFSAAERRADGTGEYTEEHGAALALWALAERAGGEASRLEADGRYAEIVDLLARFVAPVERFFEEVLLIDAANPRAMLHRRDRLAALRGVLTRCFDIRELAGQADRRER